jgi:hypothetical protein
MRRRKPFLRFPDPLIPASQFFTRDPNIIAVPWISSSSGRALPQRTSASKTIRPNLLLLRPHGWAQIGLFQLSLKVSTVWLL